MYKAAALQRAKARARRRVANDNAPRPAPAPRAPVAPDPLFLEEMVDAFLGAARAPAPIEDEPPFDPPDAADLEAPLEADADDEPPFDPPELEEPLLLSPPPGAREELLLEAANDAAPCEAFGASPEGDAPRGLKLPALRVHACWDRPQSAALFAAFAQDRSCARAGVEIERGGLDAAIVRFSSEESPDLLLLDTTLRGAAMLAALDRLAAVLAPATKIVILGAVNDVPLLRELANRGIEYVVAPIGADALVALACGLFAEADKARIIAVVGARGGLGASTLAQNIAWSIAERCQVGATLVDLDLAFGAAAFSFNAPPSDAVTRILSASEDMDEVVDRLLASATPRLKLLTAPAELQRDFELDPERLETLVAAVRRTSPFVVLDLPHAWNAWVRHALIGADEVLIVASPDLASLRNADNLCRLLREARPDRAPLVALSMTGVPKRPEIPAKEFAEALGADPIASFAFDPELFGACTMGSQMLGEVAPDSRAASAVDAIASLFTGREPVAAPQRKRAANDNEPPLDLVQHAPPEAEVEAELQQQARQIGRRPRALLWAASILVTLTALGAWQMSDRLPGAAPTPAPAAAATAPPVAPAQAPDDALTRYSDVLQRLDAAPDSAVAELRALAEQGYAPAQYHLAKLYELGEHVGENLALARQWTERAAAGGNVRAMHDLGVYFARGEGAAPDDASAFRWFRQAAEFDLADSQYNLGVLYEQGRGVGANSAEALFWYVLAARGGDGEAAEHAARLEARLPPLAIEQAHARADAFSAHVPDVDANVEIAPMEREGEPATETE